MRIADLPSASFDPDHNEQPAAEQGQRLGDGSGGGGGIGQRLGDGSYIPAPHPNRLGGGGGTPPGDESTELTHGGAVQLGQPGAALLGAKEQAEEAKKAAEGTIAEFDMPKILRHIQDLNYLAGDGSAQTAQRADGAHVTGSNPRHALISRAATAPMPLTGACTHRCLWSWTHCR